MPPTRKPPSVLAVMLTIADAVVHSTSDESAQYSFWASRRTGSPGSCGRRTSRATHESSSNRGRAPSRPRQPRRRQDRDPAEACRLRDAGKAGRRGSRRRSPVGSFGLFGSRRCAPQCRHHVAGPLHQRFGGRGCSCRSPSMLRNWAWVWSSWGAVASIERRPIVHVRAASEVTTLWQLSLTLTLTLWVTDSFQHKGIQSICSLGRERMSM